MNGRQARQRRATKHLPRINDLMFPQMANARLNDWPVDEHAVTRSLAPLGIGEMNDDQNHWLDGMLRTASLYVIDTSDAETAVTDAITIALNAPQYQQDFQMPPLPTSRIAIEGTRTDRTWRIPAATSRYQDFEISVDGVLIDEIDPGKHWRTMTLFFPVTKEDDRLLDVPGMGIYGDIRSVDGKPKMGRIQADEEDPVAAVALETMFAVLVNLITAKGIAVHDWPLAKANTMPTLSKHWPRISRPYWVSLSQSGQDRPATPSDRTYHCRWLVSGHWRHYLSGERTWVRPYVKGPKGAPWKGRPVHLAKVYA